MCFSGILLRFKHNSFISAKKHTKKLIASPVTYRFKYCTWNPARASHGPAAPKSPPQAHFIVSGDIGHYTSCKHCVALHQFKIHWI